MHKKLLVSIGLLLLFIVLLNLSNHRVSPTNIANTPSSTESSSTAADVSQKEFPTFESLRVTSDATPLPLGLQAGVFFDAVKANQMVERLFNHGYVATAERFLDAHDQLLYVVLLKPFKNEHDLETAQAHLIGEVNISAQRVKIKKE